MIPNVIRLANHLFNSDKYFKLENLLVIKSNNRMHHKHFFLSHNLHPLALFFVINFKSRQTGSKVAIETCEKSKRLSEHPSC